MKRSMVIFLASSAALAAASCSSSPEEAAPIVTGGGAAPVAEVERDCFNTGTINGFRIIDSDTVQLNVGVNDAYEVDAGGATCANLGFANQIALDSGPGGSSFLCVGDGPQTASIRTDQGDECLIQAVRRAPSTTPAAPATSAAGSAAE